MSSSSRPRRAGFSLIELLVVIAIIGVLMGLLLPAVQKVREAANRLKCQNNLKQIGLALHNYHDTKSKFPSGGVYVTPPTKYSGLSYLVYLLPFIEQQSLYRSFQRDVDSNPDYLDNATNIALAFTQVSSFICPTSRQPRVTNYGLERINGEYPFTAHYAGNMGPVGGSYDVDTKAGQGGIALQGVLGKNTNTSINDITDGTSNTFLVGELSWNGARGYRAWTRGCGDGYGCHSCKNFKNGINAAKYTTGTFNNVSFGSEHPKGAGFVMSDGSVRFVMENISLNVLLAASSRNSGEVLGLDR